MANIINDNPKRCSLQISEFIIDELPNHNGLHLAIAPTKNINRMEWLLEKAIEIGIYKLTFLNCEHSERTHINLDRLQRLSIAALKQSQTKWLPDIAISNFSQFIDVNHDTNADKFIAWCNDKNNVQLTDFNRNNQEMILLIGPEGDFSGNEIEMARRENYKEVKLGYRRLRTETAGLYGCFIANILNFQHT